MAAAADSSYGVGCGCVVVGSRRSEDLMAPSRLFTALTIFGLGSLLASTASADPVFERVNCANLKLEAALGNSSSASAVDDCKDAPAPTGGADATVDNLLGAIAEAEDRVTNSLDKGLEPAAMHQLFDAIWRAQSADRSQMDRGAKDRLSAQVSRSTGIAKELLRCVDLTGVLAPSKVPLPVTLTCRGKPIRRGTFVLHASGGFLENARSFTTDDSGHAKVLVGRVLGAGPVEVIVAHDLTNTKASNIGLASDPPEGARTNVMPSDPAVAVLRLNDVETTDQDAMKLVEHIEAWATRRHGITVGDKGPLFLRVQFNYPSMVRVGAKVSQPVEVRVAIELNGRVLVEKIGKSGGLADTQNQAKKQALVRALDVLRSW